MKDTRNVDRAALTLVIILAVAAVVSILTRLLVGQAFGAATEATPQTPAAPNTLRAGSLLQASTTVTTASAYGPGLWGTPLACGGRLPPSTRGVAHRYYACGKRLRVCYRSR